MGAYLDLVADVGVDEIVEFVTVDVDGEASLDLFLCVVECYLQRVDILDDELEFE